MIKFGMLFTCDRCGKKMFLKCTDNGDIEKPEVAWSTPEEGINLCPDCTNKKQEMFSTFMKNAATASSTAQHINRNET